MKAFVLAAGLGTRLRPLTDTMPKALVPVDGRPLIEHVVERLLNNGASEIVINVHHHSEQIIAWANNHPCNVPIHISDESNLLLDTGGALRKALPLFTDDEGPILVHNVDILSDADLRAFCNAWKNGKHCDAMLMVSNRQSSRQLLFDSNRQLRAWKNTTTGEYRPQITQDYAETLEAYAFSGIHLISPRLIETEMNKWPEKFSIIDFYLSVCNEANICSFIPPHLQLLDVGKISTLEQADRFIRNLRT